MLKIILLLKTYSLTSVYAVVHNYTSNNKYCHLEKCIDKPENTYMCKENKSLAWCIPIDYKKGDEPWKYRNITNSSLPWNYHFIFNILEVEEVNDKMQTVSIALYFRIKWKEPRLKIDHNHLDWSTSDRKGGGLSYQSEIIEKVWNPDLEIFGLNNFGRQTILKEMSGVEVFKSQHIKYNARVDVTFSCQMFFDQYPLDTHHCPFRIASYFSTDRTVNCTSVFTTEKKNQRHLQHLLDFYSLSSEERIVGVQGNTYAVCGFNIYLHRQRVQIFFQVYLISILFVMVSWVSFIIQPDIVPGRMGLIVTIFLVLINIFNGVKAKAPVSTSLNAVDMYLVGCIGHIFLVLAEYAMVLSIEKFQNLCKSDRVRSSRNNTASNTFQSTNKFDANAIILFPFLFIIFNIIYWNIFL